MEEIKQKKESEEVPALEENGKDTLFTKYTKSNGDRKILLMYLLLNKFDLSKIKNLEELYEDKKMNLKLRKLYGITEEYVDIKRIEEEVKAIKNPRIVDVESFEYYSKQPVIYRYTAKYPDRRLYINDMSILDDVMVIEDGCVISSNRAQSVTEAETRGFMYFYDYILYSNIVINKWHITFYNNTFSVYYIACNKASDSDETIKIEELLYQAINIEKTYTYKMVIYIITKNSDLLEENLADNYQEESYELLTND